MKRKTFSTAALPIRISTGYTHSVVLDRKQALAWLSDDFGSMLEALGLGFESESSDEREGFGLLLQELGTLHDAALEAIQHGTAKLEGDPAASPDSIDFDWWAQALAAVSTSGYLGTDRGGGMHENGFAIFGEVLRHRLKRKAEHDAKARAVAA